MVLYKCDRCNKEFDKKSNYNSHKNRKRPCKKISHKKKINKSHDFTCHGCHKIYVSKYNLERHMRSYCKVLKDINKNEKNNEELNSRDKNTIDVDVKGYNNDVKLHEKKYLPSLGEDIPSLSEAKIKCTYCDKIKSKKNIRRHMRVCRNKHKYKYKKLKKEKDQLEKEKDKMEDEYFSFMKEMANKNTTITNTTNNNTIIYNDKRKMKNMFFIMNNYRNAKNYSDLMEPELTSSEIECIQEKGPLVGSSRLLKTRCIDGLKVKDRPFHCVDEPRNKYMIRVSDNWKVDKNADIIISIVIKKVREVVGTETTDQIIKLLKFETCGRKKLLKELNRTTNIKNSSV